MAAESIGSMVRRTRSGAVGGAHVNGVLSWKGIPYAAPPWRDRRFRGPQREHPWEGIRDATRFGPMAPQTVLRSMEVSPGVKISENCLTLNVFAPESAARGDQLKPVMVWIHGGGYFAGTAAQRFYDPSVLVREGDVVVVTVGYRLGVLGFVDFTSFDPTGELGFESNLGLRDQIAALEWVRDTIAEFGGDPGDVTLFGESAGGGCVVSLLASPRAEGLFHRAIAQSAPVTSVYGPERSAAVASRFLEIAGIDPAHPAELRERSAREMVDRGSELITQVSSEIPGTLALAPVVDGDVLPDYPLEIVRAGRAHPVPLIIGTNHDESSFFRLMRSPLMPITSEAVDQMFTELALGRPELQGVGDRITSAYPAYPRHRTPSEVSRDAAFRMPSIWLAEAHSRRAPTYMYRFDHATPLLKRSGMGATHASELAYVFGSFGPWGRDVVFALGGRREAMAVSKRMRERWTSFARTGVPTADPAGASTADPAGASTADPAGVPTADSDALHWPAYDEDTRATLIIDAQDEIVPDPDSAVRRAWGPEVLSFL